LVNNILNTAIPSVFILLVTSQALAKLQYKLT
jgi:hypothetical protein